MPLKKLLFSLALLVVVCGTTARADTIVANTGAAIGQTSRVGVGVSFATPSGPSFNNITFNWFSNPQSPTPIAFGTLFILSQQYAGTPGGLSAATPGFLAQSQSISGGQYIFDPSFTIQPSTTYFFYTNTLVPQSGPVIFSNHVLGITSFVGDLSNPFVLLSNDFNFRLSGTPETAVPEPATLVMALSGLAGLAGIMRRRRKL